MLRLFLVAVDSAGPSIAAIRTYYGRYLETRAQNRTNTTYLDVDVDRNVVYELNDFNDRNIHVTSRRDPQVRDPGRGPGRNHIS